MSKNYKLHRLPFRLIALVLTLAMIVQVAPMRIFVSAEEVSAEEDTAVSEDAQAESAAVDINENVPLTVVGEVESLREESVKHFRMSDGSFMAVSYGMPVHYQDVSGQWQDIDNSMALTADQSAYQTENAQVATAFSASLNSGNVFTTSHNGTSVSMSILDTAQANNIIGANSSIAAARNSAMVTVPQAEVIFDRTAVADIEVEAPTVLNPGTTGEGWSAEDVIPENLQSSVLYEDVFPGVDLMYTAYSFNVKEEIIVKQPQASYRYDFLLELDGVTAALNEDGSISLLDDADEELYNIPAPFMQDSSGMVSYDVEYTLTNTSGGVILTVVADKDWMNAEERVFPVSIDPTLIVQNGTSEDEIYISYVASGTPTSPYRGSTIYFGYTTYNNVGEYRTFLNFSTLPAVPKGAIITKAQLGLFMHTYSQVNCAELAACVYEVTGDKATSQTYYSWINSFTWNTMPTFDSTNMIDYAILQKANNNRYYYWNLTELAKEWYANPNNGNRTIVMKTVDGACSSSSYAQPAFYGTASTSSPPMLYVTYRSNLGIEPYYTYNTMGVGAAGVAYIADNSGQLKIVKELASYASTVNPVSLSMVYNSDYFMTDPYTDYHPMIHELGLTMTLGTGWRLDCVQRINAETINGKTYIKYIDGDGTAHYFTTKEGETNGVYYDEDGLGLEITAGSDSYHVMTDSQDNKWYFNPWGFLDRYVDNNGNQTVLNYTSGNLMSIQQINNGQSAVTVATLTYSGNYISTITDAAGNVLTFGYSGEFLTSLQYNGVTIAVYDYTARRIYRLHDSESGYNIHMTYDSAGRISNYKENDGTNDGAEVAITYYGSSKTTYRDYGADRTLNTNDDIRVHYLFDYSGRTVNTSTTDHEGEVWGASTAAYSGTGTTDKTNNRTLRSADMNVLGMQYMRNGGLESDSTDSSLVWTFGTGASRADEKPRTGKNGIKGTQSLGTSTPIATKANAAPMSADYTYTMSAYVNTSGVTSINGEGIYATITDPAGNVYPTNKIKYKTSTTAEDGWVRISVAVPCKVTGTVSLKVYADGVTGNFYLDDFFVEYRDVVTDVNLLENGFAQYTNYGWTLGSHAVFAGNLGANVTDPYAVCFKMMGVPLSSVSYFYQDVPINLPSTETFVLSGWGLINAVPDDQADRWVKKCGLVATIVYKDGTTEEFYAPFNADIQDEWQFTSVMIVPKSTTVKTIDYIRVMGTYQGNANDSFFDSISLIRQSTRTMQYDGNGNLVSVLTNGLKEDTNTYSGGNLIKVVTGGNGTYEYDYDSTFTHRLAKVKNELLTQSYGYDGSGNVTSTTLSSKNGSKTINSSATYGGNNNRVASITDSSGSTVTYTYGTADSQMWGAPTAIKDAKNVTVNQEYDDFGRITKTFLANAASLAYTYSGGDLTKVTRTNTATGTTQAYNITYDGFGNMTSLKVGSRTLVTYTYGDRNGLPESMTDANGNTTYYTYDFLGRLVSALDGVGSSAKGLKYTYNGDGQISSVEEVGYTYSLVWKSTYDSLGRLVARSQYHPYSFLLNVAYNYNENSQLTKEEWLLNGGATYANLYTYHSADGSLNTMTHATGQTSTYAYDYLRRLSSISSGIHTRTYTYRDISSTQTTTQVSSLAYSGIGSPITFGYTYDAVGNIATYAQTGKSTVTYTYDSQGQLLKATGGTTYTYTYDTVGNILTASNGTTTHSYTYGNSQWRDLLTAYDGQSITYDTAGNPTSYYNGTRWTFTWGKGKRLLTASDGTNTISFSTNEDGTRAGKTVNGTRYDYIFNGSRLMREYYSGAVLDFIYDADGRPFALNYNGTYYYYVLNLQGDVIRLVNSSGATVASYEYDPYGKVLSATGSMAAINPLRYRGYYYDEEIGLYYLQSRYYDPSIGRFINADDTAYWGADGTPISYNLFAYCKNNPVMGYDPSGHFSWTDVFNTAAAVTIVALAVVAIVSSGGAAAAPLLAVASAVAGTAVTATAATTAAAGVAVTGLATMGVAATASIAESSSKQGKDYIQAKNNKQANQWAQEVGYDGAEELKADIVGKGNGSKFNMYTDRSTGEIILIGLKVAKEIATQLFRW